MKPLNLLPPPRSVRFRAGCYFIPGRPVFHLDTGLDRDSVLLPLAQRLSEALAAVGVHPEAVTGPIDHPRLAIRAIRGSAAPDHADGYQLDVEKSRGITIHYRQEGGLRASVATLRQLLREFGRRLPCLTIRDFPDFKRRGVMLDISRGRVPKLETLLGLVDHLADFKINEFQLYTEHTFAYRNYEPVWRAWSAITGEEILRFDQRCRELGIDLVPNQNSFGHLRYWLEYPPLRKLAEVARPYEGVGGTFLRFPSTLAPDHPGTMPFLRGLYDELLPHFTSRCFNVGCDETWDLGRGQSRRRCARLGKGRVYVEFLKRIHQEVEARGKQMQFWGDIILHYPELMRDLPRDMVALNWGYEADHPFDREGEHFARSGLAYYVCPGTATWMTLIGRDDIALANLRRAAESGRRHGALGYLNTDWGDGGHPQPLAVSYLPYLAGASCAWFARGFDESLLVPVLSREVFGDRSQRVAGAARALGLAHRKFGYTAPNVTPFGAVIAAPKIGSRELFCRDGSKYYARIEEKNIQAALAEAQQQHLRLISASPSSAAGEILTLELRLAAMMAEQSCRIMLWQQALADGREREARMMAKRGIEDLRALDHAFREYWPLRNKGTTAKCSPFLQWRIQDYAHGRLAFPPELARLEPTAPHTGE